VSGNEHDIRQLRGEAELAEFARFPFRVYHDRAAWWPPDLRSEAEFFAGRSQFAAELDLSCWGAFRDGTMVARVGAVINHRYIRHWHEPLGHLAHFEALPGQDEPVEALLERALQWLAERGMKFARSGFAAFLDYPYAIDHYGELPSFLLRGNPDYYHAYFKNAGFETEKGHLDYTAALTPEQLARYEETITRARQSNVTVLSWRQYGFKRAVDAWTDIINESFARHWGWNPVGRDELRPIMAPLEGSAVPELSIVACIGAKPVGAVFSVPDLSSLLARVQAGARLSAERGGGKRGALINLGVLEEARRRGVATAMAARSFLTMASRGMRYAGYTLVLDDNWPSRRTAAALGARVTGNFVTYRKVL
jgi:ribosomal protein S18 acetylase RimI-like enzyme